MRAAQVLQRLSAPAVVATLALFAAPVAQAAPGLVGAYGFEEPSGAAAADTSGAGNAGTIAGATRTAAGRYGAALSFDGSDDRVNVADSASLDLSAAMTLSAWVRPLTNGWRTVLLKERPGGLAYALYSSTDTNRPSAEITTSGAAETRATAALPTDLWSHLTTTYDGATLRLFVNGAQVASRAISGSLAISSGALRIGGNAVWGEYFRGLIDEVRVYNRALSVTEIQGDMNAPVGTVGDTTPPIGPSGVTLSRAGNDVTVSWTAATDNVGVTGYRIHRATVSGFTPTESNRVGTAGASATSFTDTVPAPGFYYYRVVAVDEAGNAAASGSSSVTVPGDPPPPPSDLEATPSGLQIQLAWSQPAHPVAVTTYRIHRSTSDASFTPSSGNLVGTTSSRTFTDPAPPAGTVHYRVVGVDVYGAVSGDGAVVTTAIPPDTTPPTVRFSQTRGGCPGPLAPVSDRILLVASVSDDRPGAKGELLVDGQHVYGPSPGGINFDWGTYQVPDGEHVLSVVGRDAAGNEATATCDIVVDNPERTIEIVSPADGATVRGVVAIGTEAREEGELLNQPAEAHSTLLVDGQPIANPAAWDTRTLPNGTYTLRADLKIGWLSSVHVFATDTIQVVVDNSAPPPDTTAPVVTLEAGCDGRVLSEYLYPIRGNAPDDRGGPVTVEVRVDGTRIYGPVTTSDAFQFGWSTRQFEDGPRLMTVHARDEAGNERVFECPWTVDNRALTVPIVVPDSPVGDTVTVRYQPKADGEDVSAPVQLLIDGVVVADGFGPYEYAWDTTGVSNGEHTIEARMFWPSYSSPQATANASVTVANAGPAGLVAAYGFEEPSGTSVTDSSPSGVTGTVSGATRTTAGRFGSALSFDGLNDLVSVPDASSLDLTTGMTLSAWVRPTAFGGDWRTVMMKSRPGGLSYALYAHTDTNRPAGIVQTTSEADARGATQLPLDAWTHLAATYDGANVRIYVNGTLAGTRAATEAITVSSGALQIGGNTVWSEWFQGLIDEVRVYDRALSATEIAADGDRAVVGG